MMMMMIMFMLSAISIVIIASTAGSARSIGSVGIGSTMTSNKQRRSLADSLTGSGSATSYMTTTYYRGSTTCGGNHAGTSSNYGGFCMTDGTTFWIDSYSSDDKDFIMTTTQYSDNKCTTATATSTITNPKTCVDMTQIFQSAVPVSIKFDAGTGTPKKEYNVLLGKDYYSADCSGPVTSIYTNPLGNCLSDVDNGVTMSMKNSCHNSTHSKREIYMNNGDCSGTATTTYSPLGCESYANDDDNGNGIVTTTYFSSNYECVPKEEVKKPITPLVYLAILGVIPIFAVVYLFRATLFSSCSSNTSDNKVYVEKGKDDSQP